MQQTKFVPADLSPGFSKVTYFPSTLATTSGARFCRRSICSRQITCGQALAECDENPYFAGGPAEEDRVFVFNKLELSPSDFDELMNLPRRKHRDYPSHRRFYETLPDITAVVTRLGLRYK